MTLCIAGSREVKINGALCRIEKGMYYVQSPLISIYEISRDEGYEELSIFDDASVFFQGMQHFYDMILSFRVYNKPYMLLDENYIQFFIERKSLIDSKRKNLQNIQDGMERQLVYRMIHLLEQETLLEFLHLYYRKNMEKLEFSDKKTSVAFKFIYSLHQHFKNERSVSYYANEANLSLSHFTRLIKIKTGKAPSQWIAEMTINNAKLLLRYTERSIKEISAELNFSDQFTFCRYFRQHTSVSPKKYRLKNQKGEE